MHACMYLCLYLRMCACMYVYLQVCCKLSVRNVFMYVRMNACVCMYVCVCIYMYVCLHAGISHFMRN